MEIECVHYYILILNFVCNLTPQAAQPVTHMYAKR